MDITIDRTKSIFRNGLIATLVAVLAVFIISIRDLSSSTGRNQPAEGELLTIPHLAAGDQVVLVVGRRSHRGELSVHTYQIAGGAVRRFGFKTNRSADEPLPDAPPVTWHTLSEEEAIGLESYLAVVRRAAGAMPARYREVKVGHYRAGKLIGQESLSDEYHELDMFFDEEGQMQELDDAPNPSRIPFSILREVIPPWILERRIRGLESD